MSIVQRVSTFLESAMAESKKVTWPSRIELRESTTVVLVSTFMVMLYLFVVDRILGFFVGLLLR